MVCNWKGATIGRFGGWGRAGFGPVKVRGKYFDSGKKAAEAAINRINRSEYMVFTKQDIDIRIAEL